MVGEIADSGYNSTEELIRRDQAELSINYGAPAQYPPQPEVEFGFPQTCYCGGEPLLATSYTKNDPGRRYYTCEQVDDGEFHVWKLWDVAVMEEMKARDKHILQLAEKVDNLTFLSDFETEQKLVRFGDHLYVNPDAIVMCNLICTDQFVGVMIIVIDQFFEQAFCNESDLY
uniref:Zinc finger GRF-type domain-containing protein n=1 Tax=Brassica oleracea var. oleracea TaxID=109376 RepID=A0A0D3AQ38_BRAOL